MTRLLRTNRVLMHPFVIEELACGYLPDRLEFLNLISSLPQVPVATHREVLGLIITKKLYGTGVGSVDVHIIASAMLAQAKIWSKDKALIRESTRLDLAV